MSSYWSRRREVQKDTEEMFRNLHPALPQALPAPTLELSTNTTSASVSTVARECPTLDFTSNLYGINSGSEEVDEDVTLGNRLPSTALKSVLAKWSLKYFVSHSALSALLADLQPFVTETLPKTAKTLLKTPRKLDISFVTGGKYFYFGVLNNVLEAMNFSEISTHQFPCTKGFADDIITITLSTDGIPLCKSSGVTFWPILMRVDQSVDREPRLCALFCGNAKPSCIQEFLRPLIVEIKELEQIGFNFKGRTYKIRISSFIADAPARAFVKCIKGHTAYHSCERCEDEGEWLGRVAFSNTPGILRSDESFRLMRDSDHHVGVSPLSNLNIGFVSQFALDYMHLVCLGVMRKLLHLWLSGPLSVRLSSKSVKLISSYLLRVTNKVPGEFARRPRSLNDINRYKATEFRQFLLYTGPLALRKVLDSTKYRHFLLLHCSMRILLFKRANDKNYINLAKALIAKFVKDGSVIYGPEFCIYNVHSLLHLADDAINYGPLDNVSSFPFENYMQKLKRYVRGQRMQLEQVVKRIFEEKYLVDRNVANIKCANNIRIKASKIEFRSFTLSTKHSNNCFVDSSGRVCMLKSIVTISGIPKLKVQLLKVEDMKLYPIPSNKIGVYRVRSYKRFEILEVKDVYAKCVIIPSNVNANELVCIVMHFE